MFFRKEVLTATASARAPVNSKSSGVDPSPLFSLKYMHRNSEFSYCLGIAPCSLRHSLYGNPVNEEASLSMP